MDEPNFKFYEVDICDKEAINNIYEFIYDNFVYIVNSRYGVCIVQKCLEEGNKHQRQKICNK